MYFLYIFVCVFVYANTFVCKWFTDLSTCDVISFMQKNQICSKYVVYFHGAALQSHVQKMELRRKSEFRLQQIEHTDSRRITILSWFLASLQRRRTRGERGGGGQSSSREEQRGRSGSGGREEEEPSKRREADGRAAGEGEHRKEDGHKLAEYQGKSRSSAGEGWMRSSWRASGGPGDGGWRSLQPFPAAAGRITPRRGKYGVFLFLLRCLVSTISTFHFVLISSWADLLISSQPPALFCSSH